MSINDDFVDTARLRNSWSKFVDMMREALCDLRKSLQSSCGRRRNNVAEDQVPLAHPSRVSPDTRQPQADSQAPVIDDDRLLQEQMLRAQMFQQFLRQQQELLQQQQLDLQQRMNPAEGK